MSSGKMLVLRNAIHKAFKFAVYKQIQKNREWKQKKIFWHAIKISEESFLMLNDIVIRPTILYAEHVLRL